MGKVEMSEGLQSATTTPVAVGLEKDTLAWARDPPAAGSGIHRGRMTDVKPNMHWVLEPVRDGYVLRPVKGWYEFGPRCLPADADKGKPKKKMQEAEEEIREVSKYRHLMSDRWSKMVQKRNERVGAPARVGKAMMDEEVKEDQVMYAETEFNVEQIQAKKRRKLQKRAMDVAEDQDAPVTANTMLDLKRNKGEDGWDFSDEDQFSDDEPEKVEFDDQLQTAKVDEHEDAPSGDENAEEGEDAGVMDEHGKQLEVLIKDADSNQIGNPEEAKETEAKAPEEGVDAEEEHAADNADESQTSSVRRRSRAGAETSNPAVEPQRPAQSVKGSDVPNLQEIRRRVIDCFLRNNDGSCTPQAVVKALGVEQRDKNNPFYRTVLSTLKEVADVKQVGSKRVLMLKPELSSGSRT